MIQVDYHDIPGHWPVCINEKCRRRNKCLRYLAMQSLPESITSARCLLPRALDGSPCKFFVEPKLVRMAKGFGDIFQKVTVGDLPAIRSQITGYFGSRSSYYRYKNGEKLLTPKQQQWISDLFKKYGYSPNVKFNSYLDTLDFTS